MSVKSFAKDNFVLLVGIGLPILLMFGFVFASTMPVLFGNPPQYDMIFASTVYSADSFSDQEVIKLTNTEKGLPVSLRLVLGDDGVLRAHYIKKPKNSGFEWKRLYRFDAKTGAVHLLPLPVPKDVNTITGVREEIVEATKNDRFDPNALAPDGYRLVNNNGYSNVGLLSDLFGSYHNRSDDLPHLQKGASKVLLVSNGVAIDYANTPEFIGWAKGSAQ